MRTAKVIRSIRLCALRDAWVSKDKDMYAIKDLIFYSRVSPCFQQLPREHAHDVLHTSNRYPPLHPQYSVSLRERLRFHIEGRNMHATRCAATLLMRT